MSSAQIFYFPYFILNVSKLWHTAKFHNRTKLDTKRCPTLLWHQISQYWKTSNWENFDYNINPVCANLNWRCCCITFVRGLMIGVTCVEWAAVKITFVGCGGAPGVAGDGLVEPGAGQAARTLHSVGVHSRALNRAALSRQLTGTGGPAYCHAQTRAPWP